VPVGRASDEDQDFCDVNGLVGVDLEHGPAASYGRGDLLVPELLAGSDGVEVPSVTRASSAPVPIGRDRLFATAEDLDHPAW
jgi:hypothetical protein